MSATQTHFTAVCPHCSIGLKVRRVYLGQRVVCKQCGHPFTGEERDEPGATAFGDGEAVDRAPAPPQEDRIIATCPNCQAALRVRRRYIGNNVICRECERTFLVLSPPDAPSNPADVGPRQAGREQSIGDEGVLLRAEADRLRVEGNRLRAEIEELRRAFERAEQAHGDELSRRDAQLRGAREQARDAADVRGQCDRFRAERDQLQAECDRLRSGVEDLRRTLEEDQRTDRQELTRVEAELVGLAARNRELEDLYESTRQVCTEYQDRNQGLLEELARLRLGATARSDSERPREAELPREVLTGSWEIADFADPSASQPATSAASSRELQAVRIEVDDLKRRLTDSERLQREMAGILEGMGIRFRTV